MDKMSSPGVAIAACVLLAAAAAAETPSVKAGTCAEVRWRADIVARWPDIPKACVGVVERNGTRYVKLSGKVSDKGADSITVLLDHTQTHMMWLPMTGDMVSIDGKEVPAMSVVRGQKLRFYLPVSQVAER
jgi:hypothetical protein